MNFFDRFKGLLKREVRQEDDAEPEIEVPIFASEPIPLTPELEMQKKESELIAKYCGGTEFKTYREIEYKKI